MVCKPEGERVNAAWPKYRRLCIAGAKLGMRVFVFTPDRIDWSRRQVVGLVYDKERSEWAEMPFDLPDLVYDRFFSTGPPQVSLYRDAIRRLRGESAVRFLGNSLGDKWQVYRCLLRSPRLAPFVPRTELLRRPQALIGRLRRERELFLKPLRGCQGKGAIHLRRADDGTYAVRGRDERNAPIHAEFADAFSLVSWVRGHTGGRPYLAQPYLALHSAAGDPFDVRSLMQKNGRGLWQLTGLAVRKGQPGSATSNLHGGGTALEAKPFLTQQFGEERASRIIRTLTQLSAEIPPVLESFFGRLAELGIDFGVDRGENVWILEVNSKPGRAAFSDLPNKKQRYESVYNPVLYARFLLQSRF